MKRKELARLFYIEVLKIQPNETLDAASKIEALYRLLHTVFMEVTRDEKLQFTTLFARISFAFQKYEVPKQTQFYTHAFRKQARAILHKGKSGTEEIEIANELGLKVVADTILSFYGEMPPKELADILPIKVRYKGSPVEVKSFKPTARVVVMAIDEDKEELYVRDELTPSEITKVKYNIAERNENFNPTIKLAKRVFDFPITMNLIDVEVDAAGVYRPQGFVIEPDYLMDVSAVSECFKDFGAVPLYHLLKRFLPFVYTKYLMIGNIANFFLDELMTNPEVTFNEVFPKVFRLNPLAFVTFENAVVKEIMSTSRKHFSTLQRMVKEELAKQDIPTDDCFLEPSFFSQAYGIQGRLDVFYKKNKKESAIIELKSGKTFKPNKYGINHNHFVQTLLYDLIVRSVFGKDLDPKNYILYSGEEQRQLRFAPRVKAQQMEAIQLRNQLVAIEYQLSKINTTDLDEVLLFKYLHPMKVPEASGFLKKDLGLFQKVYSGMNSLERKYFNAFSGFIAREHQLAKTGVQGMENINGLASLWLNERKEKDDSFELMSGLHIKENKAKEETPIIIFERTEQTNPLANFRKGDIAVLYPADHEADTVLNNQMFKGSIVAITAEEVWIQLRSRQFNDIIFEENKNWNIEHDMMDSSFMGMYRNLFQFAQFPAFKKALLLTTEPPQQPEELEIPLPEELTKEQQIIFKQAICAKDYFLLWGPPGTGKTSMMLKNIVRHLLNDTDENILLLAYTNRAVDEICEAIESIDKLMVNEYIRIGSKHGTSEHFHNQLLNTKIEKITTRKELKEVIDNHRIFVSTVASMGGKQEILQLKTFHRVIIDEASQIPEPMLVGMLPHFKRFLLIGDHKQLPAVVVQRQEDSKVQDEELQKIGLHNLRDSLFERMYKQCLKNKWNWAFAKLSQQGRMHEDIMQFPSEQFYHGGLKTLTLGNAKSHYQLEQLELQSSSKPSILEELLLQQRMVFLPAESDFTSVTGKTNAHEAALIAEVVEIYQKIYANNGLPITKKSIGVITPYRAQIAQIRDALQQRNIDANGLTIDTVERYQGGAREVILISLCTNKESQLASLVSLSDEGVDRKLNVALTRARKHLVLVGNPDILNNNPIYKVLIEQYMK